MTQVRTFSRLDHPPSGPFQDHLAVKPWPTKQQLLVAMPEDLTEKDVGKAWRSLAFSLLSSVLAFGIGCFIPLQWIYAPAWFAFALITGTLAVGCWVLAHECGHNAFHPNKDVEDCVGFVLHSLLLVPYFPWQRSHSIHHAHCNHLEAGETHVPSQRNSPWGAFSIKLKQIVGPSAYAVVSIVIHLLGWPLYLLFGFTGGPEQGFPTSHFINIPPFNNGDRKFFPGKWKSLMRISNIGLLIVVLLLAGWAQQTSLVRVLCVYGLPYLVINSWLVIYTWLQHTDTTIPHFSGEQWDWAKGALQTVDRPYGPILNFLHHEIGSTHVAHHLNPRIPHYNARRATELIRSAFPDHVRYDPTPIHAAIWRIGMHCSFVDECHQDEGYYYS